MRESCGIFGIFGPGKDVARITYFGLYALQHRGQESSGIAVSAGKTINLYKRMGLVSQVFNERIISGLKGKIAIGHNRYGTTGSSSLTNAQPLVLHTHLGHFALAHNGNLANTQALKRKLFSRRESFTTTSDSEVIAKVIAEEKGDSWEQKISRAIKKLSGAYSLVIMTANKLFAVRDQFGIRPLVWGKINSSFVIASESAALTNLGINNFEEVKPGEIIRFDGAGLKVIDHFKSKKTAFCIFEYIYFARADSVLNGKTVYLARVNAGRILAQEHPVKADLVISVPDSGTSAAIGFAQQSSTPFIEGLIKSRYIGRTFIQPEGKLRQLGIRLKFNPIEEIINKKDIVVVDDSIVRGTTTAGIIKILKKGGARKIHLRIASPPFIGRCFLGVDIERYKELIANNRTLVQIRKKIGCDSLGYLSIKGLKKAIGKIDYDFCTGCFTKDYPVSYQE